MRRQVIIPVDALVPTIPTQTPTPIPIQREPGLPPLAQVPTGKNYLGTLVQDINKEIFMLLNPNELDKYCSTDEKIQRLCENDKFIEEYLGSRGYQWLLQPLTLLDTQGYTYDDPAINFVLDTTILPGQNPYQLNTYNRSDTLIRFLLRRYFSSQNPLERERGMKLHNDLRKNVHTDVFRRLYVIIDLARTMPELRNVISYYVGVLPYIPLIQDLQREGYLEMNPLVLGLIGNHSYSDERMVELLQQYLPQSNIRPELLLFEAIKNGRPSVLKYILSLHQWSIPALTRLFLRGEMLPYQTREFLSQYGYIVPGRYNQSFTYHIFENLNILLQYIREQERIHGLTERQIIEIREAVNGFPLAYQISSFLLSALIIPELSHDVQTRQMPLDNAISTYRSLIFHHEIGNNNNPNINGFICKYPGLPNASISNVFPRSPAKYEI